MLLVLNLRQMGENGERPACILEMGSLVKKNILNTVLSTILDASDITCVIQEGPFPSQS